MKKFALICLTISVWFLLVAFQIAGELSPGTEEVITLVVALIVGLLGMSPLNWIKTTLKVEDDRALLVLYAVSLAIGALGMWASGQLFDLEFTWMNVVAVAGTFISAAKYAYERMKARSSP